MESFCKELVILEILFEHLTVNSFVIHVRVLSSYVVFKKVSNRTPGCVFLSEDRNNLVRFDLAI